MDGLRRIVVLAASWDKDLRIPSGAELLHNVGTQKAGVTYDQDSCVTLPRHSDFTIPETIWPEIGATDGSTTTQAGRSPRYRIIFHTVIRHSDRSEKDKP